MTEAQFTTKENVTSVICLLLLKRLQEIQHLISRHQKFDHLTECRTKIRTQLTENLTFMNWSLGLSVNLHLISAKKNFSSFTNGHIQFHFPLSN